MSNIPPEAIATLKKMAAHATAESTKFFAKRITGMTDPKEIIKVLYDCTPLIPGCPMPVLIVERYMMLNILGRSGALPDELYCALLKEINPMVDLGLIA